MIGWLVVWGPFLAICALGVWWSRRHPARIVRDPHRDVRWVDGRWMTGAEVLREKT